MGIFSQLNFWAPPGRWKNTKVKSSLQQLLESCSRLFAYCFKTGCPTKPLPISPKASLLKLPEQNLAIEDRKQSVSRIAVITGLTRKEVSRLLKFSVPNDKEKSDRYHRASRVVSGWRRDKDFLNSGRRPAIFSIIGPGKSFQQLVKRYSGDIPHRAILDELLKARVVSVSG